MSDRPLTIDIREPLLLKAGELCLVADRSGAVLGGVAGMGLFYRDCRYLGRYELRLQGRRPLLLASSAALGFAATVELTNRALSGADGRAVGAHQLGILRRLVALEQEEALADWLSFRNFGAQPIELTFALTFRAGFEDVLALRGARPSGAARSAARSTGARAPVSATRAPMASCAASRSPSRARPSWRRAPSS